MMNFFAWKLSDQYVVPFMGPQILQVALMGKIYALKKKKIKTHTCPILSFKHHSLNSPFKYALAWSMHKRIKNVMFIMGPNWIWLYFAFGLVRFLQKWPSTIIKINNTNWTNFNVKIKNSKTLNVQIVYFVTISLVSGGENTFNVVCIFDFINKLL